MQCKVKSNKSTFRYLYYQELNQLVHTEYQITPFRIGKEVIRFTYYPNNNSLVRHIAYNMLIDKS